MSSSDSHAQHSPVKMYWVLCVILCTITFLEWLIFEKRTAWNISGTVMVPALLAMSLVKFFMVVGWYMHLKYDHNWLKFIFVASLIMGASIAIGLCVLM